jgi:hypothetical protein
LLVWRRIWEVIGIKHGDCYPPVSVPIREMPKTSAAKKEPGPPLLKRSSTNEVITAAPCA